MAKSKQHVVWHGGREELILLRQCVREHCTCPPGQGAWIEQQCSAHQMLADQRMLDHLAFARGLRDRYIDSEWMGTRPNTQVVPATERVRLAGRRPAVMSGIRRAIFGTTLVAFLFATGVGAWAAPVPSSQQIASWQSR